MLLETTLSKNIWLILYTRKIIRVPEQPELYSTHWQANEANCKRLNHYLDKTYERTVPMSKRKGNFTSRIEFLNVNLTAKETSTFKKLLDTGEYDIGEFMIEVMFDGGKFSVNHNVERKAYYATIIFPDGSGVHQNHGFSAHAKDPMTALLLVCYKWLEILKRDLSQADTYDNDSDFG